jgi:hypothetical protein
MKELRFGLKKLAEKGSFRCGLKSRFGLKPLSAESPAAEIPAVIYFDPDPVNGSFDTWWWEEFEFTVLKDLTLESVTVSSALLGTITVNTEMYDDGYLYAEASTNYTGKFKLYVDFYTEHGDFTMVAGEKGYICIYAIDDPILSLFLQEGDVDDTLTISLNFRKPTGGDLIVLESTISMDEFIPAPPYTLSVNPVELELSMLQTEPAYQWLICSGPLKIYADIEAESAVKGPFTIPIEISESYPEGARALATSPSYGEYAWLIAVTVAGIPAVQVYFNRSGNLVDAVADTITFTVIFVDPWGNFVELPVTATIEGIEFWIITSSAGANGSISPAGEVEVSVNYGTTQEFEITPAEGYEIDDVLVDGESVGAVSSYLFEDIDEDHTIEAIFSEISETQYTLYCSASGSGIIDPTGEVLVDEGSDYGVAFWPNRGYAFSHYVLDGETFYTPTTGYVFTDVIADHTITVYFV